MFNSQVSANDLIKQLKDEIDIAIEIPDETYIGWINSTERLLYTEIIQEQRITQYEANGKTVDLIAFDLLATEDDEDNIRFEDVNAVFADDIQLIKSTVASGNIFPNTYFKCVNDLGIHIEDDVQKITVCYFVKPKLKETGEEMIALPIEFLDLLKAKLRGEAYKVANEAEIAAMWINDYNTLLTDFSHWIAGKKPEVGI